MKHFPGRFVELRATNNMCAFYSEGMHKVKRSIALNQHAGVKTTSRMQAQLSRNPKTFTHINNLTLLRSGASMTELERHVQQLTDECHDLRVELDVKNKLHDSTQQEMSIMHNVVRDLQSKVCEFENLICYYPFKMGGVINECDVDELLINTDEIINPKSDGHPEPLTPKLVVRKIVHNNE